MPRSLLSREERSEVLALKRREGLSFGELEAQTGIGQSTLRVWSRRAEGKPRPAPRHRFVEVDLRGATSSGGFEVELAGGRVVRVPAGFDATELRRLLGALESSC